MPTNDEKLYRRIGEQIKSIRRELNMSQEELAQRVSMTRTSISNIERGFQKLPLHLLYDICHVLNIEVTAVLPAVVDVQSRQENELVEFDGQKKQMTPKAASFVRSALKNFTQDDDN